MNKIGTAHVLLSDSIHTLPIEEENDGRGGLCESWSATGVSSLSTTVVLLRLASASGKQIRDRGRRCRGRGSVYDDDGGPAPVRRTRSSMRQMRCGGRVRRCKGEEHEGCGAVEKSILRWESSAAYEVVDEADALRWTSAPM